jgi:hypothetical protein
MKVFHTRICDEEKIFHILVNGFTSKGFCIANFELFFMVMTKKITNLGNNLGTHNALDPRCICEISKGHF